jgi:NADH:ubiquinone oxidoreductase subunit E
VEEVAVCRCTACLMAGGGRVAQAIGASLGTELGRPTPDGRIRFTWCPTHLPGAPAPLVTVDGEPQPEVTVANAATWAQALAGEHPATRTVH